MIIDYSVARPSIAALKAMNVTAAGRYIGEDGEPGFGDIGKNITRPEAKLLLAAGIDIFLAFEYGAAQAAKGARQGEIDAQLARRQLQALGAPESMTVYFAVDFDIPDYAPKSSDPRAKLGPVGDYFNAIKSLALPFTTGIYGGYYACKRALDAGLADMAWQTIAWSGGQWDPRAVLRQQIAQILGGDVDRLGIHTAPGDDFGQWPRPRKHDAKPPRGRHQVDGNISLNGLARWCGITPERIVWLTARAEASGWGVLQRGYVHAGDWSAKLPDGTIVWLP